jgi:RNA ligase (TIGR02306 family)
MRKLVTIQKIADISPIENADMIELATVLGWQVVVKKGEFKVGDYCVWHEIDSFLPIHPRYEFLRKGCYKNVKGLGEGFRLKTIRLRGQISQGLALPLSAYDIYQESDRTWKFTRDGGFQSYIHPELEEDLSEIFGVIKYEPPVPASMSGNARGNFPSFIPKTDQNRIQNLLNSRFSAEIIGQEFEVSIKLDGTSMTVYNHEAYSGVCSRNWDLKLDDNEGNLYVSISQETGLLNLVPDGFAVQGEVYGLGIQGNRDKLDHVAFYIFDVYNIKESRYLTPDERMKFFEDYLAGKHTKIRHVPVNNWNYTVPEGDRVDLAHLLQWADDTKSLTDVVAEGLVFKRKDGKFSFKCISNKFLMETDG